jgi:hypothetical protein
LIKSGLKINAYQKSMILCSLNAHITAQLHKKSGTTGGQAPLISCNQTLLSGSSGHQGQRWSAGLVPVAAT